MAVRRVYLVWTNPLFFESARLMLQHPDLVWLGSSKDLETAREEIHRFQPDTILFERTTADYPAFLVKMVDLAPQDVRIIGLSLGDNEISLFHHEHQTVVKASDLIQFVLG